MRVPRAGSSEAPLRPLAAAVVGAAPPALLLSPHRRPPGGVRALGPLLCSRPVAACRRPR